MNTLPTYHCPSCGVPFQADPAVTPRHTCRECGSQHKFKGRVRRQKARRPVNAAPVGATATTSVSALPAAAFAIAPARAQSSRPTGVGLGGMLGNVIWIVFGGGWMAINYFIIGLANFLIIIGIPAGLQCFKLGEFSLFPFGKTVESTSTGCFSMIANVIWFFTGGVWLSLNHVFWGLLLLLPIVTWPFAVQHFKLAGLALFPFGKEVVSC